MARGRKRIRVALFTPLPPARTGTADYAASLASELGKRVDLKVYSEADDLFDPSGFDVVLYQIGNNPYHAEIYRMALRIPGVIVLHEANVHHLLQNLTAARGKAKDYIREVMYEILGRQFDWHSGKYYPIDVPQPHQFTMLRRLLDHSRACIVHSRYAERHTRLKGFTGPVEVIPHGAEVGTVDGETYRELLGIDENCFLVGVFGYQRPDKQIWDCMIAFRQLLSATAEPAS